MSRQLTKLSRKDELASKLLSQMETGENNATSTISIPMGIMESANQGAVQVKYDIPKSTSRRESELPTRNDNVQGDFLSVLGPNNDRQNERRCKSCYENENSRQIDKYTNRIQRSLSRMRVHNASEKFDPDNWFFVVNRNARLNTWLLDAIEIHNNVEVESLLHAGANPNATCRAGHISACHVAAYSNSDSLHLLLSHHAEKNRKDKFGRTPLHLAAWAGRNWTIAMLLDFPTDLQYQVALRLTPEAEKEILSLRPQLKSMIDVPCELSIISVIPQSWKDSIEHRCKQYMTCVPKFFSGWTPLHIASCAGHHNVTHLLLAAGANPNSKDAMGRTPLDIAGSACFMESRDVHVAEFRNFYFLLLIRGSYVRTIKSLVDFGGQLNTVESTFSDSALHIAVELRSVEAFQILLDVGAPAAHRNARGNTPLHECVEKLYMEPLQVLVKYCVRGQKQKSVDVTNSAGYTVLHTAILASWIPGVCILLDAGADITLEAPNGYTAIHIAAREGNLDILDIILLNAARYENSVIHRNGPVEPPLFCAIRSGNLDCVQTFIDAGVSLNLSFYLEPKFGDTTMEAYLLSAPAAELNQLNMILHGTAEVGNVEMLKLLLDHDHNLQKLLDYRCPYLMGMIPVEFAAHHNKFHSFKFLLQKTIERAQTTKQTFDSSKLLDIIATHNREDLFKETIKHIPDVVRMATEKGHYPLHEAAKNGNREMILQLIHNGADLSQTNKCGDTAIRLLLDHISKPTEFIASIFDGYIQTNFNNVHNNDCEITIDYRVLIPTLDPLKDEGQMRVLTALLQTDNRKNQRKLLVHPLVESFLYLKWITLSTYFYMMIFFYILYVIAISAYIVSVFYYKDKNHLVPVFWNPTVWTYLIYLTLGIIIIQELSFANLTLKTWTSRIFSIEFWVKCGTYCCATATPFIITIESADTEWRRHFATLTLVLAWLNIMMLLSKTPMSGYYIQMFWKVSEKIIKILLTFLFLVLMFSFCFMVQFHSREPFEDPWASIVKTLVMMTSEFDYGDTFIEDKAINMNALQILRGVFVVFLVLAAIVLMNLMIGVAVHDVQNLVHNGNLRRLDKQVGFLNRLELSRGKKSFFYFLGLYRWFHCKNVPQVQKITPVYDSKCCYKSHIKEAILNKAQEKLRYIDEKTNSSKNESKLEEMILAVKEMEQNILIHLLDLKSTVADIQKTNGMLQFSDELLTKKDKTNVSSNPLPVVNVPKILAALPH